MATTTPSTGWPDSTNTGVPAGTTLTPSGDLVITQAGAVISGLDIHGTVYINADNVTIKNCKITSPSFYIVQTADSNSGTVIQDCEINGVGTGNDGISASPAARRRFSGAISTTSKTVSPRRATIG